MDPGLEAADQELLNVEKYKTHLAAPKGKDNDIYQLPHDMPVGFNRDNDDDDFFHVTCHIDSLLKEKIVRGEFVELDKLLPKDRAGFRPNDEGRLEIVSKDGVAYFTPAQDRSCKINGLKRWEQAFRVYAAIYS